MLGMLNKLKYVLQQLYIWLGCNTCKPKLTFNWTCMTRRKSDSRVVNNLPKYDSKQTNDSVDLPLPTCMLGLKNTSCVWKYYSRLSIVKRLVLFSIKSYPGDPLHSVLTLISYSGRNSKKMYNFISVIIQLFTTNCTKY